MRGVRSQVLVVAVAVLVAAVAVWTWIMWSAFDSAMTNRARAGAELQAGEIAHQLRTRPPAEVLDPAETGEGDVVAQVVTRDGTVLAASSPELESAPIASLRPRAGHTGSVRVSSLPPFETDPFVVVALGATDRAEPVVVLVAEPVHLEPSDRSRFLVRGLVAAVLVLLVAAVVVRWAVGQALQPVERLRVQLAGLDRRALGDRVDVPTTGDELTRLGVTMNELLERLETAYAAQEAFVSDASHELRSPLATIRTNVDLASADSSGREWARSSELVRAEVRRLESLVDDLLVLSRSDSGALHLRRRPTDLDDLVVDAVRRLGPVTPTPDLALIPVQADVDADRLGQVVRNLLDNALRHAETRVRVSLEPDDGEAVLCVDNDGPPVPGADRERVFERFVRLESPRSRDAGGSGLGLAIAADLVRAHGGTLVAGAAEDGWCRFEVRIPAS